MLRFVSAIHGQPVIAQQQGRAIGTVTGNVLDPERGKIVAYTVGRGKANLLSTSDILGYFDDGVLVPDDQVLQPPGSLVRVQKLQEQPVSLIGLRAVDTQDKRLGKLRDCLIDTQGHFIAKLFIRPGLLGRLWQHEIVIPRERVVRITPKEAVVQYDMDTIPAAAEPEVAP